MAPPPSSAAEVRSPCWRRAIHRTKGQCWRHISPGPAGRSLSRQLRRQPIREPSRTQARLTVLPLPTTRWRIVTDHPSLYHSLRSAGAISLPPHTPCRLGAASTRSATLMTAHRQSGSAQLLIGLRRRGQGGEHVAGSRRVSNAPATPASL